MCTEAVHRESEYLERAKKRESRNEVVEVAEEEERSEKLASRPRIRKHEASSRPRKGGLTQASEGEHSLQGRGRWGVKQGKKEGIDTQRGVKTNKISEKSGKVLAS